MYFNNYSSKESDIIEDILNHDQMLESITEEHLIQKRKEDHNKSIVDQKLLEKDDEWLVCW